MVRTQCTRLENGLHDMCKRIIEKTNAKTIVEIGCLFGESTAILAQYFEHVYAVDTWSIEDMSPYSGCENAEAMFDETIKNLNVTKLKMESTEAARRFGELSVDGVYIDADHGYESVRADIDAWTAKTKLFVAGHDYAKNHKGVVKAVDEKFSEIEKFQDGSWLAWR